MKQDNDLMLQILNSPVSNTSIDTMLIDEEKLKEQPEVQDKLDIDYIFSKPKITSEKYKKAKAKKLAKNPNEALVETPRGKKRLTKAIGEGFDPETGEFGEAPQKPSMDGMPPELMEKLKMLMASKQQEGAPIRKGKGAPVEEEVEGRLQEQKEGTPEKETTKEEVVE